MTTSDEPTAIGQVNVQLTYQDKTYLQGALQSIKNETVTLRTSFSNHPIRAPLAGVSELKFIPG